MTPFQALRLRSASGAAPPGQWNTANATAGIAFSNADKTATRTTGSAGGDTYVACESETSHNTGKWYCEVKFDSGSVFGTNIPPCAGISLDHPPSTNNIPNNYTYMFAGALNASGSALAAIAAGDVVCMAVDLGAGKLWFGKNGTWQGGGDPAAGTGQQATGLSGTYYVHASQNKNEAAVFTLRSEAADMQYTIPSGFSAWA